MTQALGRAGSATTFSTFEAALRALESAGQFAALARSQGEIVVELRAEPDPVRAALCRCFLDTGAADFGSFLRHADGYFDRKTLGAPKSAVLEAVSRVARAAIAERAAAPRAAAKPAPVVDPRPLAERLGPSSERELLAWAAERGVSEVLGEPVSALEGLLPAELMPRPSRFAGKPESIAELLLLAPYAVRGSVNFKRAALDALAAIAPELAAGRAYEAQDRPDRRACAPGFEPLLEPTRAAWRAVRGNIAPRRPSYVAQRRTLKLGGAAEHPTAVVTLGGPGRVTVTIPLKLGAMLSHKCTADDWLWCRHALVAYDELLQAFTSPPTAAWSQALAQLARPLWLRELDAVAAEPPTVSALSYWISLHGSAVHVQPVTRRRGKRGEELAPKVVRPADVLHSRTDLPLQERQLLDMLALRAATTWVEREALLIEALEGLPNVVTGPSLEALEPTTVTVLDPPLEIRADGEAMRLVFVVDGAAFPARSEPNVRLSNGQITLIRPSLRTREIIDRVGPMLLLAPAHERARVAERVAQLSPSMRLTAPELVPVDELPARDHWITRLAAADDGTLVVELRVQPLVDGPQYPPGEPPARALAPGAGGRLRAAARDLDRERAALAERADAWGLPDHEATHHLAPGLPALRFLAALRDDPRGAVEWSTAPLRMLPRAARARFSLSASKDWFGVEGELELGEHKASLALLLDAARRRSPFVPVAPGTWLEVESTLLERLAALDAHVREVRGRHEVGALSIPAVTELLQEQLTALPPHPWQQIVARARAAADRAPEVPTTLTATLRAYQREGFRWLARLSGWGAGAVLADDMGLGKTVQAIAALLSRADEGPALVVAPTSVVHNWRRELARFAPSLRALGARDAGVAAAGPRDVVIISYGVLVRDVERMSQTRWSTLVVDEAQLIKNPASRRNQAVRSIDAAWRLALSGTPVENHLGDLWAVFAAVAPGLLGSWEHFRAKWVGRPAGELDGLRRLLRPFLLRRTKEEVLAELPPKTEVVVDVELSPAERQVYEDARLSAVAHLTGLGAELRAVTGRFKALAELTRLRQLACDPSLVIERDAPPSSKLARLVELVSALIEERHSVLVFSQFTRLLDRAEARLEAAGVPWLRLDGSTPEAARGHIVDAFQGGPPRAMLVSLKAGGTGLNLTAADYVIHLDPWWNPAAEDQATDRAHRIGQTRPLTVLRLVSRRTVESTILDLHADKRALAAAVLEGGDAGRALDGGELLSLLEDRALDDDAGEPDVRGAEVVAPASVAPASVAPSAPAPEAAGAPAPTAAREADWAALARAAGARMDAELSASTARRYRSTAEALVTLARAAGLTMASPDALLALWVAEIEAGRRARADLAVGRAVARRLCAG